MQHLSLPNKLIYFLQRESSKDALRNILIITIPSVIVFYAFNLPITIAFVVGIILSALTDIPGNVKDKRLTAALTIPAFFIAALLSSFVLIHLPWFIILMLGIFGFLCNYSLVLGPRIGAIGNLTLIVISFTIGLKPHDIIPFSLALSAGAMTFFSISMLQVWLFPTRSLKHAMDDGFENMSKLIRLKVKCYTENIPLEEVYKELSLFHIKVSEQLEIVRSLLLREKTGATAVVEGIGDHGCEYMTGGRALILGETGRNFAAGMSGGIAWIYDTNNTFSSKCNLEMVDLDPLETEDETEIIALLKRHILLTKSEIATFILENWNLEKNKFVKVFPREYKNVLSKKLVVA